MLPFWARVGAVCALARFLVALPLPRAVRASYGLDAGVMPRYPGVYHAFDHPELPERVLTNVKLPPDGHSPTVGSNPEARADAILKVKAFLAANLK